MTVLAAEQVRLFILERFEAPLARLGLTPADAPDDLDLLGEGVTDSLGLLELIGALEQRFAIEVDFEDLDPEELTSLGPFCRYVAERAVAPGSAGSA